MIAADSSTLVAYFSGETTHDTEILHKALLDDKVAVCPIVITEILSATHNVHLAPRMAIMRKLAFMEGFWERAGAARRVLISKKLKARVADAVIAQACIDHDVPLLTRDHDFRHYAKLCGLKLA